MGIQKKLQVYVKFKIKKIASLKKLKKEETNKKEQNISLDPKKYIYLINTLH